jgi:hypothetical protein
MAASPSVRLLTVAMVLNVLALFFLGLRFHARRLQKAVISMDDYTLILAVVRTRPFLQRSLSPPWPLS